MTEDEILVAVLAAPGQDTPRLVHADWLDDHGDAARAAYLRASVARDGAPGDPAAGQTLAGLAADLDPGWVAAVTDLVQPFVAGSDGRTLVGCPPEDLPFTEPIGLRGRIATFASQFRGAAGLTGIAADLAVLTSLPPACCYYGAADGPVSPFLAEFPPPAGPVTAADVLAALRPRHFRTDHIPRLDLDRLPYPGYHPGGAGGPNDEIHNDFTAQYVFPRETPQTGEPGDELDGTHGVLKRAVAGGQLWYVLLHTTPHEFSGYLLSSTVVLFVVGRSRTGDRLVGVMTSQVCHNLCD